MGLVAHNSFIQGFTELGVLGGTLLTELFFFALSTLHRLGPRQPLVADPERKRLRPHVMAIVAAYSAGMPTISRNYIVMTYMFLGPVDTYLRLVAEASALRLPRLELGLARRFVLINVLFMIAAYSFVRMFTLHGG